MFPRHHVLCTSECLFTFASSKERGRHQRKIVQSFVYVVTCVPVVLQEEEEEEEEIISQVLHSTSADLSCRVSKAESWG